MSKEILILKHVGIEGPGTIEAYFKNTAWRVRVADLNSHDLWLEDLLDIAAIVSLGGSMNVYEEKKYPFLKEEDEFLKRALNKEIPVLGICLGAQLLAKASGAKVKKAPLREIGWFKVNLTDAGKQDRLFQQVSAPLDVFQWHEDTFDVPDGGQLLAASGGISQAFRIGRNAYGLQFHIEVTPQMIESWISAYTVQEREVAGDAKEMLKAAYKNKDSLGKLAERIYSNFAGVIEASKKIRVS